MKQLARVDGWSFALLLVLDSFLLVRFVGSPLAVVSPADARWSQPVSYSVVGRSVLQLVSEIVFGLAVNLRVSCALGGGPW